MNDWLQHNVVRIKSATETAGGGFTMHAAMKPGERNNGKLAAGACCSHLAGWPR